MPTNTTFKPVIHFHLAENNTAVDSPRIEAYRDTTPVYQVAGFMQVLGTSSTSLPVPAIWTQVTTIGIVNLESEVSVSVDMKTTGATNGSVVLLGPAPIDQMHDLNHPGGQLWLTGMQMPSALLWSDPKEWLLKTDSGGEGSPPALIYYFLAGY